MKRLIKFTVDVTQLTKAQAENLQLMLEDQCDELDVKVQSDVVEIKDRDYDEYFETNDEL